MWWRVSEVKTTSGDLSTWEISSANCQEFDKSFQQPKQLINAWQQQYRYGWHLLVYPELPTYFFVKYSWLVRTAQQQILFFGWLLLDHFLNSRWKNIEMDTECLNKKRPSQDATFRVFTKKNIVSSWAPSSSLSISLSVFFSLFFLF